MSGLVAAVAPKQNGHNTYANIVEDEFDLVGLVAYSLYKRDKLQFIERHSRDTGAAPTHEELMVFCRAVSLDGQINAYKTSASNLLTEMYDEIYQEKVDEVEEKYKGIMLEELKQAHPFWPSVWQHFLAGLMTAALFALVAVILYSQKIGVRKLISELIG